MELYAHSSSEMTFVSAVLEEKTAANRHQQEVEMQQKKLAEIQMEYKTEMQQMQLVEGLVNRPRLCVCVCWCVCLCLCV